MTALVTGCAPFQEVGTRWQRSVHLDKIRFLARNKDYDQARLENRQVLDRFPDKPPGDAALYGMGLLLADDNNPGRNQRQALDCFHRLRDDFPQSPLAVEAGIWTRLLENELAPERISSIHLERVRFLARNGDFDQALLENRQALDRFPDKPPGDAALYGMGLVLADNENPGRNQRQALDFFRRLRDDFPQSPLAVEAGIWTRLLENELAPERISYVHLERIKTLTRRGNFHQALVESRQVLQRFPDKPPGDAALFGMGLVQVHFANPQKDYKKALELFTRLKNEYPNSPFKEESKTWIGILKRMEQAARVDIEIEERTKQLKN